MKIAVVTDTHFGARRQSKDFLQYFNKFFQEVFFPYIDDHKIDTIIHIGDLVDHRKTINFLVLNELRRGFLEPLKQRNIHMYLVVGNHDVAYKNSNDLNSPKLLLSEYDNVTIFDETAENIEIGNMKACMIPWINKSNKKSVYARVRASKAQVAFGHLELNGYEVLPSIKFEGGHDPKFIQKFDLVFSGHFHQRQAKKNVHYIGTPYEITWSDYRSPKGFVVLDTDTLEFEHIDNPHRMFHKVVYNDEDHETGIDPVIDINDYANCYVQVIVYKKTNSYKFDKFLEDLESVSPVNVNIVEESVEYKIEDTDVEDLGIDTITILNNYIDQCPDVEDKDRMKQFMFQLYNESLTVE